MEQLLSILLSNQYKQSISALGIRLPPEFNTARNWIQFLHDVVQLDSGLRDCYLIDYPIPPHNVLLTFINTIKTKIPTIFNDITLIPLNEYLCFMVNKRALLERMKNDIDNGFSSYTFINVSPCLSDAKQCDDCQYHKTQLSSVATCIIGTLTKNEKEKEKSKPTTHTLRDWMAAHNQSMMLDSIYPPVLSGWLCNYPVVYCNSAHLTCFTIKCPLEETERRWQNNCISMTAELIRYEVSVDIPSSAHFQHLNGMAHLKRIQSFTVPSNQYTSVEQLINQWKERYFGRWDQLKLKIWSQLNITNTMVSNTVVNL
ncbi:hypothetical protein SAMD00019534_065030 [Acytostelium subglobosum LB1]|uniref:hypothetical protein n=1 Tax=Acytostelium subglobosum LB1 TaxID=1410327 RepID=UPI0006447B64|nr:hypothetical protein SAMD00019534_065030 [Acytostelium subglobosum LB1]GAM23328.1 hypothetical protein SAMD00019534_065030 [Acytostelium subglobosum LB1]|eukprot:XP_012753777.1 hypothetical protein SAMD00019534_065030 [Acytostelium subglobosum LB1]